MESSAFKSLCRASERAVQTVQGLLTVLLIGCTAYAPGPPAPRHRLSADLPYLVSPMRGYRFAVEVSLARRIEETFSVLVGSAGGELAVAEVEILAREYPGLHPTVVLAAQGQFLARDYREALGRLSPVAAELPSYEAAQLLMGRCLEKIGDLPGSVEAYRTLTAYSFAARRVDDLRPRAAEILAQRVEEFLSRGRVEDARNSLARMEDWAPGELSTLRAAVGVAAAAGDLELELEIVRRLASQLPEERTVLERRAELEVEVGDPALGLRGFQALVSEYPEDELLAEKLARAKFRWRLLILPPEVQELIEQPELARAEFAALLFWLFPDIRYGRVEEATIANDVFGHPLRAEIVRVVNLGLMRVDRDLHEFRPERPIMRREALASFLRILQKGDPLACLMNAPLDPHSVDYLCRATAACGLLPEPADCLPSAKLSGAVAMQMSRKTLEQLGIQ